MELDLSNENCKMFAVSYDAVQPAIGVEANYFKLDGTKVFFYFREWEDYQEPEYEYVYGTYGGHNVHIGRMVDGKRPKDTFVCIINNYFQIDPIMEGEPVHEEDTPPNL